MAAHALTSAKRKKVIAAVHIARQQLGMDDDTYRALVRRVSADHGAEVASSAKCSDRQLCAVLDEMRRKGAQAPGAKKPGHYPGKPHNFYGGAMPEMVTKIEAQLADMGLPWEYADAIAKQQWKVERIAWLRDPEKLRAIVAALHTEQRKRGFNEFIDRTVKELGLSEKALATLTDGLPKNWRRQIWALEHVGRHLQARLDMLRQKEAGSAGATEEES